MKCVLAGRSRRCATTCRCARCSPVGVDGARLRQRALDRQGGAVRPPRAASRWRSSGCRSSAASTSPTTCATRCSRRLRRRRLHLRRAGRRRALLDRGDVHVLLGEPPVEGDVHGGVRRARLRSPARTTGSKAFSILISATCPSCLQRRDLRLRLPRRLLRTARRRLRPRHRLARPPRPHAAQTPRRGARRARQARRRRRRRQQQQRRPRQKVVAALAADDAARLAALLSRYGYTLVVAFTSAMLAFPFGFFRSSPREVTNELFGSAPFDFGAVVEPVARAQPHDLHRVQVCVHDDRRWLPDLVQRLRPSSSSAPRRAAASARSSTTSRRRVT